MKKLYSFLAVASVLLLSCANSFAETQDTVTELVKKGQNTFVAALTKTDYLQKVATGTYTALPPTDVAFRNIPKAQFDALMADKEKLTVLISHHLIEGKLGTADLKGKKVKTVGGSEVIVTVSDGKMKIKDAVIVRPDLPASNGVIHVIDKVLQP